MYNKAFKTWCPQFTFKKKPVSLYYTRPNLLQLDQVPFFPQYEQNLIFLFLNSNLRCPDCPQFHQSVFPFYLICTSQVGFLVLGGFFSALSISLNVSVNSFTRCSYELTQWFSRHWMYNRNFSSMFQKSVSSSLSSLCAPCLLISVLKLSENFLNVSFSSCFLTKIEFSRLRNSWGDK